MTNNMRTSQNNVFFTNLMGRTSLKNITHYSPDIKNYNNNYYYYTVAISVLIYNWTSEEYFLTVQVNVIIIIIKK